MTERVPSEAFFFGNSGERLYGVHHRPSRESSRLVGIVLCHPMGHEYIRAHGVLVRLAVLLAQAGFHVLRFDYYGCGDSEGTCEDGDIGRWVDDIAAASDELRRCSSSQRICLLGLRLGGALALMAAATRTETQSLILWDPIVDGRAYVDELRRRHQEWLRGSFARAEPPSHVAAGADSPEALGFPLPPERVRVLEILDLFATDGRFAGDVLLVETAFDSGVEALEARLREGGASVEARRLSADPVWAAKESDLGNALLHLRVLRFISSWAADRLA